MLQVVDTRPTYVVNVARGDAGAQELRRCYCFLLGLVDAPVEEFEMKFASGNSFEFLTLLRKEAFVCFFCSAKVRSLPMAFAALSDVT